MNNRMKYKKISKGDHIVEIKQFGDYRGGSIEFATTVNAVSS